MDIQQKFLIPFIFLVDSIMSQTIKCGQDVTTKYSNQFIPMQQNFKDKLQNILYEDDESNIKIIGFQQLTQKQENCKAWNFILPNLLLIQIQKSDLDDYFQFMFKKFQFSVKDDELLDFKFLEMNKKNIELQNCQNLREVFLLKTDNYSFQSLIIICDYENFIFIFRQEIYDEIFDSKIFKPNQFFQIQNNRNCFYKSLQFESKFNILLAELNFQEWKVYTFKHESKELLVEQFDQKILRNINILNDIVYLIFDHDIYYLSIQDQKMMRFEQKSNENYVIQFLRINEAFYKIILNNSLEISGSDDCKREKNNDFNCIFIENYPEEIFVFNKMLLIKMNQNQYFIYRNPYFRQIIEIDIPLQQYFYNYQSMLFGIKNDIIYIMKVKEFSPYFNCNNYINSTWIKFLEFHFYFNQIKTQNFEITYIQEKNQLEIGKFQLSNNVIVKNRLFSFYINDNKNINNYFLNQITFKKNDKLNCSILKFQIQRICQHSHKIKIIWQEYYILNQLIFLIYQTYDYKIYILDCQENKIKHLDILNNITTKKIYRMPNYFIILYNNLSNLFLINLIQYPQISSKHFAFDFSVIKIIKAQMNSLVVIFSNSRLIKISNSLMQVAQVFNDLPCDELISYKVQWQLVCITNQQMISQQLSYTIITTLSQGKILSSIYFYSVNEFILLLEKQNTINFYKYSIFDFKFVELFKLPLFNYSLAMPIKYIENGKYLIVQAKQSISLMNVLLIYILSNDFDQILHNIILDVDDGDFQFISEDSFYYQQNSTVYYQKIDQIEVQCELQDQNIIFEEIELEFYIPSRFNKKNQQGILKVKLDNQIESLRVKNGKQLYLNYCQDYQYLDIRHLVIGQASSMKSNDFDILFSIELKKHTSNISCPIFKNIYCINQIDNYILNIFTSQTYEFQFKNQSIVYLFEEYTCEFYISDNKPHLTCYQNFSFQSLDVILQNVEQPSSIFLTKYHIFALYFDYFEIYEIEFNNLKLIDKQILFCSDCKIKYLKDDKQKFIIYNSYLFKEKYLVYIEYQNFSFSLYNLQIIDYQKNPIRLSSLIDINQIYEHDNQIYVVLIYNLVQSDRVQIYEGIINKIDQYLILGEAKTNLRIFTDQNNNILNPYISIFFESLSDDLIYIKSQNNFNFYNISQYAEFKILDPIYQIQSNAKQIKIINSTYFILLSFNEEPHTIYEIKSYQIKIKNQDKVKNKLIIYNNISEVEIEISFQISNSSIDFIQKVFTIGVFLIIIGLILFLIRRFILLKRQRTSSSPQVSEIFQNLPVIE